MRARGSDDKCAFGRWCYGNPGGAGTDPPTLYSARLSLYPCLSPSKLVIAIESHRVCCFHLVDNSEVLTLTRTVPVPIYRAHQCDLGDQPSQQCFDSACSRRSGLTRRDWGMNKSKHASGWADMYTCALLLRVLEGGRSLHARGCLDACGLSCWATDPCLLK